MRIPVHLSVLFALAALPAAALAAPSRTEQASRPRIVGVKVIETGVRSVKIRVRFVPGPRRTWVGLRYGLTDQYGSRVKVRAVRYGRTIRRLTFVVSNLSPGTTYHFAPYVRSGERTVRARDRVFVTDAAPVGKSPRIAAAGDIACDPDRSVVRCAHDETAAMISAGAYDAVLALGDLQYERGELNDFLAGYDPTWGAFKAITYPAVGNHEYLTRNAAGYFDYFGAAAGDRTKGYYSFNLGAWHIVVLNSNCSKVGGCKADSPQIEWLAQDLRNNQTRCSLATWHHPRFSSGLHGDQRLLAPMWQVLQDGGVDVALVGHDHDYERFAPQNAQGVADAGGIRQFVVGTGGKNRTRFRATKPNSEVRDMSAFGFLELGLRDSGYDWNFKVAVGGPFSDSGSANCS